MIPVSLKIKGLYSFQEEQSIDFTSLIDAQIFGIFGTVGSGKSTILEAISFALFANTERLNSRDNRNYNMMNLKSDELLIDFEFNNFDGELYRFVVKGKRHGSEFGKVSSFTRNAYHWQQDNWIPIGSITAEEIVGLSYENFRRTIIIPQGQFQEFLELGGKERSDMLKELFHLDKYDLSGQTASLERKNNAQMQYVSGQLAQFEHVTPAHCEIKEKAIQSLDAEVAVLRKELAEKEILAKEQGELKKVFEELATKKEILKGLEQKEPEIIFNEKKVAQYESCVQLFKNQLETKKDLQSRLESKQKLFSETNASLKEVEKTLMSDQQEFGLIEPQFQNLERKKDEVSDYQQIIKVRRLSAEITDLEARIAAGEEKLNAENAVKLELTVKIQTQKQLIQAKKEKLPNLPELTEVKSWFAAKHLYEKNIKIFIDEKARFETFLKNKKETVPSKIPISLYGDFPYHQDEKLPDYIARLEKQKYLNATKSETIQAMINHLGLQSKLEEFTQKLHDHEACPLCGSLDHPHIMSVENVHESLKINDEKLENVRKETALIEQAIQELVQVEFELNELLYQVETAETRIQKENEILKSHLENFKWSNYNPADESTADDTLANSKTESASIQLLEKELELQEKNKESAENNLLKFNGLLQEIKNQVQIKSAERKTFSGLIKVLDITEITGSETELSIKAAELEHSVKSIAEKHEVLSKKIVALSQQKMVLNERIASTVQSINDYGQQLEKLNAELAENLEKSTFSQLDEVISILEHEIDVERIKAEINDFRQFFYKSKSDVLELEKAVEGKQFSNEMYTQLLKDIELQETNLQTMRDAFITETALLEKLKAELNQKMILAATLEGLNRRDDNIRTMKNLFKGSGFVNYISTVYLQNLCEMANVRFYKLTRQQLRLEIGENNEFLVRDYLNEGKMRSVKTLSGGQIFQAALSLALALAESIQQQSKAKQNFFFLDEGFGSQDKVSLQMVFDSLKALREENRVIGVISHVEDLQQEIDMYLQLENDPETGSKISKSWKE